MNNFCLYIYIFIWCFITYREWKRQGFLSASVFLFGCYFVLSIISFLLYNDSNYDFKDLTLFPFIYLIMMVLIASAPIMKFNPKKNTKIQQPTLWKLNAFVSLFILTSILDLPNVISEIQNIPILLFEATTGVDLYRESIDASETNIAGQISNLPAIINGLYSKIGAFLLFYYLSLDNKNKWIIVGLIYSLFTFMLGYLMSGQRGGVFHIVLCLIASFFLLRTYLSKKIIKIVNRVGLISIITITIPIVALTISRFGEENNSGSSAESSIYFYMGQSSLYFNNYGLDDNGIRYGDRTLTLFKKGLGFDNVPLNFWEGRKKYPHLYIGDDVFSTFVGDFTIDFGPIVAFILFSIASVFFCKKTSAYKGIIPFHRFILLFIIFDICTDGAMFLFPYGYLGNLTLIFYILVILFFKLDYLSQKKNHKYE